MEKENKNSVEICEFQDLRGTDLSGEDLALIPVKVLDKTDFDTKTKWPDKTNLPEGFDPEKIIEECKNPGLRIRELHQEGIDGSGVKVAIIDQKLLLGHKEYKDQVIDYSEYGETGQYASMHGTAVASLLVGKNCGIAPEAKLIYKGVAAGRNFKNYADALLDILEINKNFDKGGKIRIISCSIGFLENNPEPGLQEWIKMIKKAEEEGIILVDTSDRCEIDFTGGGSSGNKENIEDYERWLGSKDKANERIIVPSDYRTMACWKSENEYMHYGKGGMSWSVPYLAGLFALAVQINPNASKKKIAEAINKTVYVNKKGLKVVNPRGIIEAIK